jgi:hypothetical protein
MNTPVLLELLQLVRGSLLGTAPPEHPDKRQKSVLAVCYLERRTLCFSLLSSSRRVDADDTRSVGVEVGGMGCDCKASPLIALVIESSISHAIASVRCQGHKVGMTERSERLFEVSSDALTVPSMCACSHDLNQEFGSMCCSEGRSNPADGPQASIP